MYRGPYHCSVCRQIGCNRQKHPTRQWPAWTAHRYPVYGDRCELCGSTKRLDRHHIDHLGRHLTNTPNDDPSNLLVLCHKCHIRHHNGALLHEEKARQLRTEGKTYQQIGDELGITRQRVHQLLNPTCRQIKAAS